jgi:hypothetical protein
MKLNNRIAKLERALTTTKTEDIHMCHFIVEPGNLQPRAYVCEGIVTHRCNDESHEQFIERCIESVEWPDGVCHKTFEPFIDTDSVELRNLESEVQSDLTSPPVPEQPLVEGRTRKVRSGIDELFDRMMN